MPIDHDAVRSLRVVREQPPPPPRSSTAEAAARYRARRRGVDVPKRKPGPKPATVATLRQRIRELERQLATREGLLRIGAETLRRQISTLTVEQVAGELLDVLTRDDRLAAQDTAERQVLLRDVVAAVEDRQEHWPG
jgi:hypothetical protein